MTCPYCGEAMEPREVTSEHVLDGPGSYCPECYSRLPAGQEEEPSRPC